MDLGPLSVDLQYNDTTRKYAQKSAKTLHEH